MALPFYSLLPHTDSEGKSSLPHPEKKRRNPELCRVCAVAQPPLPARTTLLLPSNDLSALAACGGSFGKLRCQQSQALVRQFAEIRSKGEAHFPYSGTHRCAFTRPRFGSPRRRRFPNFGARDFVSGNSLESVFRRTAMKLHVFPAKPPSFCCCRRRFRGTSRRRGRLSSSSSSGNNRLVLAQATANSIRWRIDFGTSSRVVSVARVAGRSQEQPPSSSESSVG